MKLSEYLIKTQKEIPADASLISHKLMIRSCMIKQTTSGIYTWLPLGLRVLKKIEGIIRKFQNIYGCQELLMPTIQQSTIWKESGRYNDYGPEMLKFVDRNKKELLYGPTNEELITYSIRDIISTYKDLPKNLYQIQWKFRDEIRPRFGVMRCREFLMKDNYSFDLTVDDAKKSYDNMFKCYLETFQNLGIKTIPVKADPGAIGGDMSHEFHIISDQGDTEIIYDKKFNNIDDHASDKSFKELRNIFSVTKDIFHEKKVKIDKKNLINSKGFEVGHIFFFGDKYSSKLNLKVVNKDGTKSNVQMGSYGIGISRLAAAIIESSHDKNGIIWPKEVSPFDLGLINLDVDDKEISIFCKKVQELLGKNNKSFLYDDTPNRPGEKFANMDLIGLPLQVIVGKKNFVESFFELKNRKTNEISKISLKNFEEVLKYLN